jgi:hypothetical protein
MATSFHFHPMIVCWQLVLLVKNTNKGGGSPLLVFFTNKNCVRVTLNYNISTADTR